MKLIIAGGRDFNDSNLLKSSIDPFKNEITEVVCGLAKGADTLGKAYAINNNIPIKYFPANWSKYNKYAGIHRNKEMGNYIGEEGMLIAFWDGNSVGTKHMIEFCRKQNSIVKIISY